MQEIDASPAASSDAPRTPPSLDSILSAAVWVLLVGVLAFGGWFGYTVWYTNNVKRLSTPALRSIDGLKQLVRSSPNDAAIRIRLGEALATVGLNDEAVVQFGQALKINPKHTGALLDLGLLAAKQQQYKSAEGYFQRVVTLTEGIEYENVNAQREQALFYLGEIALLDRRYDDSISWFKAALRIRRDSADTYFNLACAYEGRGDLDQALKQLNAAIAFDNTYAQAYYEMGQVYTAKKDVVNAAYNYAKAAQLDPGRDQPKEALAAIGTPEEWRDKATAAGQKGDLGAAIDDILVARALAPKDVSLVKLNAQLAEQKGDRKAALTIYKEASTLAPNDADIKAAIKRLSAR